MSTCDNCYQGCAETISDRCIKYTGIDIPQLGIVRGDSLATVEQKIFNHLRTGEGIVIDLSGISICSIMQDYLPASQDYPPGSENAPTEFVLNDVLAALIQYSCLLQGQIGLQGQRIADNNLSSQALINEERFARVNEFEAVAGIITEISATFDSGLQTATALITSESIARANANEAMATVIDTISATVDTGLSLVNAAIISESTARATANDAMATVIDTVSANITDLESSVDARITQERTAAVNREGAIATMVETVATSLETETGLREAAVTQLTQSISNAEGATASLETNINARFTTEISNRNTAISDASISTLSLAQASATDAIAAIETTLKGKITQEGLDRNAAISEASITTLEQVDIKVGDAKADIIQELEAKVETDIDTFSSDIRTELGTWATVLGTGASNFTTLKSTVNGYSANIDTAMTTAASANGKVDAQYSLSVNAGGKVAGMKLGSNGTTSDIVFTADSFKISNGTSGTSGVISPFEVVGNQVVLRGTTVADTLITPGVGPAHPAAGWNGLSVNKNNDNAIRFRHANGQIGIEMGIINGELVLNWYNDQGVLVWKGGSSGIVYIDTIPESNSPREMGLVSSTIPENPSSMQLTELATAADQLLVFTSGEGYVGFGGSNAVDGAFPINRTTKYLYNAGRNSYSATNAIYEGFHDDVNYTDLEGFISDGWWAYWVSGNKDEVFLSSDGGTGGTPLYHLSLVYIKNGKVSSYLQVPNDRIGTGIN